MDIITVIVVVPTLEIVSVSSISGRKRNEPKHNVRLNGIQQEFGSLTPKQILVSRPSTF